MNTIFCARLKALRISDGRTQAEMADLLGVNRSTYGAYERGTILPPMNKIEALAEHFDVSVDYLAGNTNEKRRSGRLDIDVSRRVQDMLDYLHDHQTDLTLDGEILDVESREALISSLENSIKLARIINKKKG